MHRTTLGGNRAVGTSKHSADMSVGMPGFGKSNHNLGESFIGTAAPGVAIPVYKRLYTKESSMNMHIDHFLQTTPPEFLPWGAFEMRVRYYSIDPRLYIRKLHNNLGKIGRTPENIFFPGIKITAPNPKLTESQPNQIQINTSSLLHHLGYSGLGRNKNQSVNEVSRVFNNAIPILGYYDAIKNDYCNWQEENAYVLGRDVTGNYPSISTATGIFHGAIGEYEPPLYISNTGTPEAAVGTSIPWASLWGQGGEEGDTITIMGTNLDPNTIVIFRAIQGGSDTMQISQWDRLSVTDQWIITYQSDTEITIARLYTSADQNYVGVGTINEATDSSYRIIPFPLENIDQMREDLLGAPVDAPVIIGNTFGNYLPYSLLTQVNTAGNIYPNATTMNGMMLVTYKSDLHNNWLDSEFIDGDNGIAQLTAINTTSGEFTMDSFLSAKTIYNAMNRIAASKGDWEAYETHMYGGDSSIACEKPMYIGGFSADIYFDEQLAMADLGGAGSEELGFQGGVGRTNEKRNGHVRFKSPGAFRYVIGILTIVPKNLIYTDMNDIDVDYANMRDVHSPAYDGLGFQDRILEWAAAWDTEIMDDGTVVKHAGGKQPAFQEYQTAIDKAHGLFANELDLMPRILARRYEPDPDTGEIMDDTTYIDPRKFNQIFRYTDLDAQNFQIWIKHNIQARLNMGATQIPIL